MILYTSQDPYFDIVNTQVDLSKSPTLEPINELDDIFPKAYSWLFKLLKHDKFIWAYNTQSNLCANHGNEQMRWVLDVPDDECVAINSDVWNCVINGWPYMEEAWDNSINLSDDEYDKLEAKYRPIKEKTWEKIFNISKNDPSAEILVKSPILEKYVIKKEWISSYDPTIFDYGIVNYSFRDMERLEKFREIYESGLKGRKIDYKVEIKKYEKTGFGLRINWSDDK